MSESEGISVPGDSIAFTNLSFSSPIKHKCLPIEKPIPIVKFEPPNKQISLFDSLITKLAQENIDIKYRHILASTGITDYTYACYNMVRPGIIMYGHTSRGKEQTKLDLKPCTKLLSKVAYIKNVPENTSISYGRTYITRGYTKIATVPMGYADGKLQELIYGKYDERSNRIIYDNDKIKNIQARTVDNLEQCKDCKIKYYCAGGCIGEAINENGTIYSIKEKNCEAIRFLAENLLKEKIPVLHP